MPLYLDNPAQFISMEEVSHCIEGCRIYDVTFALDSAPQGVLTRQAKIPTSMLAFAIAAVANEIIKQVVPAKPASLGWGIQYLHSTAVS